MYKLKIQEIVKNPFFRGSAVLFVGTFIVNSLSYLFSLVAANLLPKQAVGEYLALMSIVYIVSIPSSTIGTAVVKYVSIANAKNEYSTIRAIAIMMTRYSLIFIGAVFIIGTLFHRQILTSLKIDDASLLFLLWVIFAMGVLQLLLNSVFTGLQQFISSSLFSALLIAIRILIAIPLLLIGLKVEGVFYAMIIACVIVYISSWITIERHLSQKKNTIQAYLFKTTTFVQTLFRRTHSTLYSLRKEILLFSLPATIVTIGASLLVQNDIILAKVFLPPLVASDYASLAIVGKVIPFFTQPLLHVMFPEITKRVIKKQNYIPIFLIVLIIIASCSLLLSGFYLLFPNLVQKIFFPGKSQIMIAPYIGLFGIFQGLYAVLNTFVIFFLSIGKNKIASTIMLAAISQAVLMSVFHQSIQQLILASITVCSIFIIWYMMVTIKLYLQIKKTL